MHRANDALWASTGLGGELDRTKGVEEIWRHESLLVSQACGLDLFLNDAPIEPFAVPVFDLASAPKHYFSFIVGDVNGSRAAVNSLSSRSGYSALLTVCEPEEELLVTGSHLASLAALREGRADVAAIDAVTWGIVERTAPELLRGIEVVARSSEALAPPYVTRRGKDTSELLGRLSAAVQSSPDASRQLGLVGVEPVGREDYRPILEEYKRVNARRLSLSVPA